MDKKFIAALYGLIVLWEDMATRHRLTNALVSGEVVYTDVAEDLRQVLNSFTVDETICNELTAILERTR